MKNQDGHWVYYSWWVERTVWREDTTRSMRAWPDAHGGRLRAAGIDLQYRNAGYVLTPCLPPGLLSLGRYYFSYVQVHDVQHKTLYNTRRHGSSFTQGWGANLKLPRAICFGTPQALFIPYINRNIRHPSVLSNTGIRYHFVRPYSYHTY